MSTATVSSTSSTSASTSVATQTKGQLNMADFIKILTVQLENQNPLEPMTDRDFFAQIAQLGQVEGLENLQSSSSAQQAQALIGQTVTAARPSGDTNGTSATVTGPVTKVLIKSGEYYVGVQDTNGGTVEVKLSAIQSMGTSANVAQASNLIGKTVAGTAYVTTNGVTSALAVNGKVVGTSMSDGAVVVQVQDGTSGTVYPVTLGNIDHVLNTTTTTSSS